MTITSKESVNQMSDSGRKINYSVRPAKCVERKIICELLSKIKTNVPIHQYRYIGFGSYYFTDFILFHNQLNIDKMVSIEHSQKTERYNFNKPYNCIEMMFCDSSDALNRQLDFSDDNPDFIWLDYDDAFNRDMLVDLITASQKVRIGSVLFISFNTSIFPGNVDEKLPILREEFNQYVPPIRERNICKESLPSIIYEIINNAVQKAISSRKTAEDISATSIFFIKYQDGAPMLTLGYYFHNESEELDITNIEALPGVTKEIVPVNLKIPCLTKSEIHEINKLLPGTTLEDICNRFPFFEKGDIEKYIKLYKFYPNYIDSPYYT